MPDTNIDKLKRAETLVIEAGRDPLVRMSPVLMRLVGVCVDLIKIVRGHEEKLTGGQNE